MSKHVKIALVIAGACALVLHFSLLFVYSFKRAPYNKAEYYAQAYISPFFHQSWQLFVPPPQSNYHLFAEFENKNGIQRTDVFNEIVQIHRANPFNGYGPLIIAFTNSIHYFEHSTTLKSKLNGPVKNDLYFTMLEHSTLKYLMHSGRSGIRNLKIRLFIADRLLNSGRVYFN